MDYGKLAKMLEGIQTVFTVSKILNLNPRTSINYLSRLKKEGYIDRIYRGHNKIRTYHINGLKKIKIGYPSIYDIINKYSRVKITTKYKYISHKRLSVEEALVEGIKSEQFRTILCALELFNYINWSKAFDLAKKKGIARNLGALYDMTRKVIIIKRMDERTRKALFISNGKKFTIKNFKSRDFNDIEKLWRVYLPFNKQDLEVYRK